MIEYPETSSGRAVQDCEKLTRREADPFDSACQAGAVPGADFCEANWHHGRLLHRRVHAAAPHFLTRSRAHIVGNSADHTTPPGRAPHYLRPPPP